MPDEPDEPDAPERLDLGPVEEKAFDVNGLGLDLSKGKTRFSAGVFDNILPKFDLSQSEAFKNAASITETMRGRQIELDRTVADMFAAERAEKDGALDRQHRALDLSAQLVEQQRLLVETQQETLSLLSRQEEGAARDRRFDQAVLLVAVIAVVAPTVTTVAVTSHNWFWSVFTAVASSIALGLLCLLVTSERRKRADTP